MPRYPFRCDLIALPAIIEATCQECGGEGANVVFQARYPHADIDRVEPCECNNGKVGLTCCDCRDDADYSLLPVFAGTAFEEDEGGLVWCARHLPGVDQALEWLRDCGAHNASGRLAKVYAGAAIAAALVSESERAPDLWEVG